MVDLFNTISDPKAGYTAEVGDYRTVYFEMHKNDRMTASLVHYFDCPYIEEYGKYVVSGIIERISGRELVMSIEKNGDRKFAYLRLATIYGIY